MMANSPWQDVEGVYQERNCWLLQGVKVRTVKSESLENFEELSQLAVYNSIVR
jgi:hypothetical protein